MNPANGSPGNETRATRSHLNKEQTTMSRITLRLLALLALAIGLIGFSGIATANQQANPDGTPMAGGMSGQGNMSGQGGMGGHGNGMGGTGAIFMVISNDGEADVLIAGATDVAAVVEIHEVADNNGVMEMRPLEQGLEIPADGLVTLQPGGYHVMLIGLTQDLMPDMTFELTLTFEKAGDVVIPVTVQRAAPTGDAIVSIEAGDLTITGVWSRPAPAFLDGTPEASPVASPAM